MEISGRVVRKPFAVGSKSERLAVLLETADGRDLVLRRRDGNPFQDDVLEALVGQTIRGHGDVHEYLFLLDDWQTVSETR